jgi:hypothetical protein
MKILFLILFVILATIFIWEGFIPQIIKGLVSNFIVKIKEFLVKVLGKIFAKKVI